MSKERKEYLQSLADEYGVSLHTVYCFANFLGPNEDYDGLIAALEDWVEAYG